MPYIIYRTQFFVCIYTYIFENVYHLDLLTSLESRFVCAHFVRCIYHIPSESKLWYTQLIAFDRRLNENCSCTCVLLYFKYTHTPNTLVPTVIIMEIIIIIIMMTMIMRCIKSDKRSYTDTRYSLYAFGLFHFINNANTTIYIRREKIARFSRGAIIFPVQFNSQRNENIGLSRARLLPRMKIPKMVTTTLQFVLWLNTSCYSITHTFFFQQHNLPIYPAPIWGGSGGSDWS